MQGPPPVAVRSIAPPRLFLALHLASFVTLSLIAFGLNAPVAFFRFDGTFLLSVAENQARWMASGGVFSANPLEGNAGLWFPTATELIPGFVVGRLIGGDHGLPAVAFAWFATEFFVAVIALGWSLGVRLQASIIGAWLLAIGLCPFLLPPPAAERIWGNPHLLSAIAVTALAMAGFFRLGRHGRRVDLALFAATLALLGYLGFSQPIAVTMAWPVFGFFALAWTIASDDRREATTKLVALAAIGVGLGTAFGPYLVGLFRYAKTTFFWDELIGRPLTWRQASFLLDFDSQPRWLGRTIWLLAVAGTALLVARRDACRRSLALPFATYLGLAMLATLAFSAAEGPWRGPVPAYLDLFAFPLYACTLGSLAQIGRAHV